MSLIDKRHRRFLSLFCLFVLAVGCTSNTIYKKPANLISEEKMVGLLSDLFIAQGVYEVTSLQSKQPENYYPLVLEKHKTDTAQLASSIEYYISKIDDYNKILKKVDLKLQYQLDTLKARTE